MGKQIIRGIILSAPFRLADNHYQFYIKTIEQEKIYCKYFARIDDEIIKTIKNRYGKFTGRYEQNYFIVTKFELI